MRLRAHRVDRVGEIFPGSGDAGHDRLDAKPAFGSDFARDARDFRSEGAQLFHHRVDGFFELQNFAADVDRDLARKVAIGHGDRDFRDVADLTREVGGHRVHVVGEVLPGAGNAGHVSLTAEFSFGADFARDAADFGCERH